MRDVLLCGILIVLAACSPAAAPLAPHDDERLEEAYQEAIEDASTFGADQIHRDLVAIRAHDERIIWKGEPGASPLLAATWTSGDFAHMEARGKLQTDGETWITIAPKLEHFCRELGKSDDKLDLRIAQLLGLPPDPGYDRVAEFWVDPDDLFRPCPDPQITDSQCEPDYPEPAHLVAIDSSHVAWMDETAEASYSEHGYPWTRLGYTYDWGNPESNIGLSEFVVRAGAIVEIKRITTLESYCQ